MFGEDAIPARLLPELLRSSELFSKVLMTSNVVVFTKMEEALRSKSNVRLYDPDHFTIEEHGGKLFLTFEEGFLPGVHYEPPLSETDYVTTGCPALQMPVLFSEVFNWIRDARDGLYVPTIPTRGE